MKFAKEIACKARELSLEGHIVLTPVFCSPAEGKLNHEALVLLHIAKLTMSKKALVLNVGGYIGDGAKDEIEFCKNNDIPVEYLENVSAFPPYFGMSKGQ